MTRGGSIRIGGGGLVFVPIIITIIIRTIISEGGVILTEVEDQDFSTAPLGTEDLREGEAGDPQEELEVIDKAKTSFQLFLTVKSAPSGVRWFFFWIMLFHFGSSKDEDTILYGNCYRAGPLFPDPLFEPVLKGQVFVNQVTLHLQSSIELICLNFNPINRETQ